ncbi:MAG: hypothetical protein DYH18_08265 [Xanthomonadales bacterium PRO7]|jgi:uncharacterized protein (DUF697 family)|nr:hypothetical protein [Xanthomonadales bacterium PRO7]
MKSLVVRSREIVVIRRRARPSDPHAKEFLALLRRKCVRAATIGACTAAAESLPGLGKALGVVFGELIDAEMLAATQRELIEETFRLYGLNLPAVLQNSLVHKVLLFGTGASVASDAIGRGLLHRLLRSAGSLVAGRALPVAAIFSSALANATVTYAIGKRAQAAARLPQVPIAGMPDALRAFTGIDERRIVAWSLGAAKSAIAGVGKAAKRAASTVRPAKSRRA